MQGCAQKIISLLFIFCNLFFLSTPAITSAAMLPLAFSSRPSFPQTLNQGKKYTLNYTVLNQAQNGGPSQTIQSISTNVTGGSLSANTGTCGAQTKLAPQKTCTLSYIYTAPNSNQNVTGSVTVNYGWRPALTDQSVQFNVSGIAAPTITNLSTSSGSVDGGDNVYILGNNLSNASRVTFGGESATILSNTDTQISVNTPGHASGTVDVAVTTPGGTATDPNAFTYNATISGSNSVVLNTNTPGVSNSAGTTNIVITNSSSTYPITGGITPTVTGTNLTVSNNGCTGTLAASASCTIGFTSSNVTSDASSGKSITVSGTNTNTLTIPIAALNVMVMSPPYQSGTGVDLLLVNGCVTPEILEVINNSTTSITGINATTSSGLTSTTTTNYCDSVTLAQNQVCMIEVSAGTATTGDTGTITISNSTNTQSIGVTSKVEAVNNSLPALGSTVEGDTVYANTTYAATGGTDSCNIFKVVSASNGISGTVPWAASATYQNATVPFPGSAADGAENLLQGQPNTISIVNAEQGQSEANTTYASGACINYTETNSGITSTNWYLPSICELGGNHVGFGTNAGCPNGTNNILTNASTGITSQNWSSTEKNATDAWNENFDNSSQVDNIKTIANKVRCSRAFTD